MKYKKYIIMPMMLALLSVATSCEQEELPPAMPEGNVVEVTAAIGDAPHTRVSQTADNEYTFDDKDKIHIVGWYGDWDKYNKPWEMASDTWWNDAVSTFDKTSGKWNTEPYMRWQNGKGLYHHFLAWWPENFKRSNEPLDLVSITLTGDYIKDDILVARWSGERPEDNVLNLKFEHLLSRFDVHLHFRDEYETFSNISIETKLKNMVEYNLIANEVKPGSASGNYIKMYERPYPDTKWDWSGTCITVPQDFAGPLLTIKFTTSDGEKSIDYTQPETAILKFRSNERITLYLNVGKNEATLIATDVGYPGGWSENETELK